MVLVSSIPFALCSILLWYIHSHIPCKKIRIHDAKILGTSADIPFLAPVKKNLTMKTCSPAIATMNKFSMMLNLKILFSVLLTVLKLRFSLVRKYF